MIAMRIGAVALALGTVALGAGRAWAYACITTTCARHCGPPVGYRLGRPSDDLGAATTEAEVIRGMEAWTKFSCTSLKVQYQGRTDESPANGNQVIAWVEDAWPYAQSAIGVTTARGDRTCLRAHMAMNGVNFRWITGKPARRGEVNAFSIIAHEGGHYYGLGHSEVAGAVMVASYAGGVLALGADDSEGICRIYGGGGGGVVAASDCRERGCAAGYSCVDGMCRAGGMMATGGMGGSAPPVGGAGGAMGGTGGAGGATGGAGAGGAASGGAGASGQPGTGGSGGDGDGAGTAVELADGQRCEIDGDCRSRLCVQTDGDSFCSRVCTSNADCVSGFSCQEVGDRKLCLPIADAQPEAADGKGDAKDGPRTGNHVVGGCAVGEDGGASPVALACIAWLAARLRSKRRRA